jgi:hypothetical protein
LSTLTERRHQTWRIFRQKISPPQAECFDQIRKAGLQKGKERTAMAAWVLLGILVFLVFGVPLIDDLYRLRARRARVQQIMHEPTSLVPDGNERNLLGSGDVAPHVKVPEDIA